jgi:hypothetical protein
MNTIRNVLRVVVPAVTVIALLPGSALAQNALMPTFSLQGEPKRKLTPDEQEKQDQLDNAYKAATNKIPDQKASNEPWGNVRPVPSPPAPKKKPQQ